MRNGFYYIVLQGPEGIYAANRCWYKLQLECLEIFKDIFKPFKASAALSRFLTSKNIALHFCLQ